MGLVIFCASVNPVVAKDKIVIGQAVSLSGPVAPSNAVGGIYVKEYGKRLTVDLKIYDDKSDIGTMTRLLEKLIIQEKVDFILPPWSTAMLFATAPIANKNGYILIGGAGGAMKLKDFDLPYFFQTLNFAESQVPALADIFKELGVKRAAIIFHKDLHGVEYYEMAVPGMKKAAPAPRRFPSTIRRSRAKICSTTGALSSSTRPWSISARQWKKPEPSIRKKYAISWPPKPSTRPWVPSGMISGGFSPITPVRSASGKTGCSKSSIQARNVRRLRY